MLIEVGKVREFARATKASDHEYFDGWDSISPPTFLTTASLWMEERHAPAKVAGLDMRRILNGSQEFTFYGPPPKAGTRLTGQGRIDKVYEKEGRRGGKLSFMEIVYTYVDDANALVAEVRSTIIETSKSVTQS